MLPLHNLKFIKSFVILKLIFLHRVMLQEIPNEESERFKRGEEEKKKSCLRTTLNCFTRNFRLVRGLSDLNFSYSLNFCLSTRK